MWRIHIIHTWILKNSYNTYEFFICVYEFFEFIRVLWPVCICATCNTLQHAATHIWTHSYVKQNPFICAAWRIHMCDKTLWYIQHEAFICAAKPFYICCMTHSYLWHNPFICAAWHIHVCDTTLWYMQHESFIYVANPFICAAWHIDMCDTTLWYMQHAAFIYVAKPFYTCGMTHSYVRHNSINIACATLPIYPIYYPYSIWVVQHTAHISHILPI